MASRIPLRNCPVCQQNHPKTLFHPPRSPGEVARCGDCGFIYIAECKNRDALIVEGPLLGNMDPKILASTDLNDLPKDHWELSQLPEKLIELPATRQNSLDALERIKKYVPNGRILDFGCGWGFFLSVAKERGCECYGLEPLVGHSLYARAKFRVEVITDTLRENTFSPNFFDTITSFQVFEHLPNPTVTINQFWNFQKPGGILLMEVPNIDTWGVRLLRNHHRHFNPDHINFFSKRTILTFLERNNYKVLEIYSPARYMTLNHFVNYWFRRFLPVSVVNPLSRAISHRGRLERVIKINLGDILGVIAQK